jgi:hypothetical protein
MAAATRAIKAEDVVRDPLKPDLSPRAQAAWLEDAAACVRSHGVIVIRDAIPPEAVTAVLEDFKVRHDVQHLSVGSAARAGPHRHRRPGGQSGVLRAALGPGARPPADGRGPDRR